MTSPAWGTRRRLSRYAVVSLLSAGLAQLGLVFGYGVAHWGVAPSVLLSLATSAPASYVLNRRYVWTRNERPLSAPSREVITFLAVAILGTLVAMALVSAAEHVASSLTKQHLILTAVVDLAGLLSMITVWVSRYVLLDRVVFRPSQSSQAQPG